MIEKYVKSYPDTSGVNPRIPVFDRSILHAVGYTRMNGLEISRERMKQIQQFHYLNTVFYPSA